MRLAFWAAMGITTLAPLRASAQLAAEGGELEPAFSPVLAGWAGGGVMLQAYAGLAAYRTASATWGHGMAGSALRVRLGYLELGGFYEASDVIEQGAWTAVGGFAGVLLPYASWVDVGASVGLASRSHRERDERYGPDGYTWSTPSLVVRLGVSDRSSESLAAVRLGMELVASFDLKQHRQPWELVYERPDGIPPLILRGETDVGGMSVGLALGAAFDLSFGHAAARNTRR